MPAESFPAARVVGERIQARRLAVGATQMELAHIAGMNVANYGRIERGVGNPTLESLLRIAASLGIDPGELVSGLGVSHLPPTAPSYSVQEFIEERSRRTR